MNAAKAKDAGSALLGLAAGHGAWPLGGMAVAGNSSRKPVVRGTTVMVAVLVVVALGIAFHFTRYTSVRSFLVPLPGALPPRGGQKIVSCSGGLSPRSVPALEILTLWDHCLSVR